MKKKRKEWKDMTKKEKIAGIIGLSAVLIVIVLGVSGAFDETEEEKAEREARQEQREKESADKKAAKEQKKAEEEKAKKEAEAKKEKDEEESEPKEDLPQDEKIKNTIIDLVEDDSRLKINKIEVVQNFADDSDGGYNALIHLVFDVKNRPKTAKGAIDATTNTLGADLAGTKGLENATFFWEVPYIHEGDNIIKIGAKQEDGKMYRVEEWYNGHYFE